MAALTPPQKIAWGLGLVLPLVTAPVGLWLLGAGLWQLHVPEWRIRTYVRQARLEPANAMTLLTLASAIDPGSAEVQGPLAELKSSQGDNPGALYLYRQYCQRVPDDWLARGHYAVSALKCNQVDEAITQLEAVRQGAPLSDDSMASVVAHLAYAYLAKEDPEQALALIDSVGHQGYSDGPGREQCLFYRGVCEYMLGRTRDAVQNLDDLYAADSSYQGIQAAKDAMLQGTYELVLPDGSVLIPLTPGRLTRSAVKVERTAARSPHCLDCQAPLAVGALTCRYCHAAVGAELHPATGPTPPQPPPFP